MARLLERVAQPARLRVDRQKGVIYGVRVLGLKSANKRRYLPEAVRNALHLYNRKGGVPVNEDHPSRSGEVVTVGRRIGWLENVKVDVDGGLRGDLHIFLTHARGPMVLEAAERNPAALGLSHNARGRTRREQDGTECVEAIEELFSVDLVADPASTAGLHEGTTMRTMKAWYLIESVSRRDPAAARLFREFAERGIMGEDGVDTELPVPDTGDGEAADHEQALLDGCKDAIGKVLDDDSLPWAKRKKLVMGYMETAERHSSKKAGKNGNGAAGYTAPDVDSEPAAAGIMSTAEGRRRALVGGDGPPAVRPVRVRQPYQASSMSLTERRDSSLSPGTSAEVAARRKYLTS